MPRMMRFEHPGSLAHIMSRGIDGRPLFDSDLHRMEFLGRLSRGLRDTGYRCLCWCLMPNHYHLLVRSTEIPMARLMRGINGGYARWYNRQHGRRGYLFQHRYRSILCQDMDYTRELIRYIHLNPIRGGQVKSLRSLTRWPWCGHAHVLGIEGATGHGFQESTEVLRRFGPTPQEGAANYLSFLAAGIDRNNLHNAGALPEPSEFEVAGVERGWPAVIGDHEFARAAMERHQVAAWRKHRQADYQAVLDALARQVSSEHAISRSELHQKGRLNARSRARADFCYRTHFLEKLPYAVIARYLGNTIPAVMQLARKGSRQAEESGRQ